MLNYSVAELRIIISFLWLLTDMTENTEKNFGQSLFQKRHLKNNKQKVYGQDSYNYHTYL